MKTRQALAEAVRHHQTGRHDTAIDYIGRAIAANPRAASFHVNLGSAHEALGQLDEAVGALHEALRIRPDLPKTHYNLGRVLQTLENLEAAEACFRRTLELRPDYAQAANNLGSVLEAQGRIELAEAAYRQALQIKPDVAEAHYNLGSLLQARGETDAAEVCYRHALDIKPDFAEAHCKLGSVPLAQGKWSEAVIAFRRAVDLRPDYVDAIFGLAFGYEKLSRTEEAMALATDGLRLEPDHPKLNLLAANCESRLGRHHEALKRLQRLPALGEPFQQIAQEASFASGKLEDRIGDPARAVEHFTEGNRLAEAGSEGCLADQQHYLHGIDDRRSVFTEAWIRSWSTLPPSGDEETPLFLTGFPRSGTTLVGQILDCHPRFQTLEEQPTVTAVIDKLKGYDGDFLRVIAGLSPTEVDEVRKAYFSKAGEFIERRKGTVLVDKQPLSLVDAGLIQRIFPSARFVVMLRHPCDACLSCFMQNFKINAAMANFFSLEDAAQLYVKAMELWRHYRRVLPLDCHMLRYEDLVDDFQGETRRLFEFLSVEWDEAVCHFDQHAKNRETIRSPSYRQVTEPIYRRARYRWRRYAEWFAPVMELLNPFIEEWGYRDGDRSGAGFDGNEKK